MTKRQCENTYFFAILCENCQKIPGVFINIYRKDKILLRNYMKLSIIILVKTLPQTLPKTTKDVCKDNFNIKSFRRV